MDSVTLVIPEATPRVTITKRDQTFDLPGAPFRLAHHEPSKTEVMSRLCTERRKRLDQDLALVMEALTELNIMESQGKLSERGHRTRVSLRKVRNDLAAQTHQE